MPNCSKHPNVAMVQEARSHAPDGGDIMEWCCPVCDDSDNVACEDCVLKDSIHCAYKGTDDGYCECGINMKDLPELAKLLKDRARLKFMMSREYLMSRCQHKGSTIYHLFDPAHVPWTPINGIHTFKTPRQAIDDAMNNKKEDEQS